MTARQTRQSLSEPTAREVTWGTDGSYVLRCSGSCRGAPDANMHSKIYAMSNSGTANNVVMVSSSNLNGGGAKLGWNDLVVMKNRPATFDFLVRMHRLMTAQRHAGRRAARAHRRSLHDADLPDRRRQGQRPAPEGPAQDQVLQRLRPDLAAHPAVLVERLPRQLPLGQDPQPGSGRLQGQDHHRRRRPPPRQEDARRRRAGLIEFWDSRIDTDDDGYVNTRTHMKSIAVRGTYGTNRRYHGVWTGTANWSNGSLPGATRTR